MYDNKQTPQIYHKKRTSSSLFVFLSDFIIIIL